MRINIQTVVSPLTCCVEPVHILLIIDFSSFPFKVNNFLGLQIFRALGAKTDELSPKCSSVLGLDSNRRLAEQKENLPFTLDVEFGPDSFPNQVSQVLVKEEEIKETQQTMMATEAEILINVESIQERANEMYSNQQVMMNALSDIQKELDVDHKDSKSKKSKKAKGEKTEEAQDEDGDLFERRLSKIEEIATSVNEVEEASTEIKDKVEKIEEVALSVEEVKTSVHKADDKISRMEDKVKKIEGKVDNMEKSIEDIKEMLSQLIMKG